MAFVTHITGLYPQPTGQVQVAVVFVDEQAGIKLEDQVDVEPDATPAEVDAKLRPKRDKLDKRGKAESILKTLALGERDIDASNAGPKTDTPEELARAAYFTDLGKLRRYADEVALGVRAADAPEVTALRDALVGVVKGGGVG